jgi:exonuclease SbcC
MRLHDLTVTAFGPFAGTEHVDFDELGQAGLFVLHGPTGAGKSSVLDAVCFALYGQVPGVRQQARAVASDHAPAGSRPEVVLEITVRGRRLRVTRSPQFDRPKHRGSGRIVEQARVLVEELTEAGWLTRSTRVDEAAQLLTGLLGMSASQFCQVVLLPQGQFAEFLRAGADERRALLENLFDTRRYADVERWLVERRQAAARRLAVADAHLERVRARVVEAAGLADYPDDVAYEQLPQWLAELRRGAVDAAEQRWRVAERRRGELVAVQAELEAGRALVRCQDEVGQLRAAQRALAAGAAQRGQRADALAAARRAVPVATLLEELAAAHTACSAVADTVRRLADDAARQAPDADVPAVTDLLDAAVAHLDSNPPRAAPNRPTAAAVQPTAATLRRALREQAATRRAELGRLRELLETEADADGLDRDAARIEGNLVAAQASAEEDDAWRVAWPSHRALVARAVETAARAAVSLETLAARRGATEARLQAARDRERLATELTTADAARRCSVDEAQRARQSWLDVRQQRLDGIAAELAAQLVTGQPCLVCGSDVHPLPAPAATGPTARDQESAAEWGWQQADERRRCCDAELGRLNGELSAARAIAGSETVARLADELATVTRTYRAASADAAALAERQAELDRLDADASAREVTRRDRAGAMGSARAQLAQLRDKAATLRADVADARGNDPTVSARVQRLERDATARERLADALEDLRRAETQRDAVAHRAARAAAGAGFPTLERARRAVLPAKEIEVGERLVQDAERRAYTIADRLTDPQLVAANHARPPCLEELTQRHDRARDAADGATADLQTAIARREALDRLHAEVHDKLAERVPCRERYEVVDTLSRLAEGKSADNGLRMSLSAYVLAARLESVAAAASDRLQSMSEGRYRLVHSDRVSGRGRGGLGLRVVDGWTGRERETSTLSGGESFVASLALALGLADVVTEEAGGAVLETLFIDEGFGSLDEDTLEDVMDVLDDLRSGGRAVGLVSHVAELRQRIPAQVAVTKGRSGSSLRQT